MMVSELCHPPAPSPPPRFGKYCIHICLVYCQINICSSASACAAASDLFPLFFFPCSPLLLSSILPFHHLCTQAHILTFFTLASRTLLCTVWHYSASHSTSSPVHSTPSGALSPSSLFQSFRLPLRPVLTWWPGSIPWLALCLPPPASRHWTPSHSPSGQGLCHVIHPVWSVMWKVCGLGSGL